MKRAPRKPHSKFNQQNLSKLRLRIRYLFPFSKNEKKINWPVRQGGESLYSDGLWRFAFYQTRQDYLSGIIQLDDTENQSSQALGLAVIDTVRLKKEGLVPPTNHELLLSPHIRSKKTVRVNSIITSIRLKKLFKKSVKAHEQENLKSLSITQLRDQYLYNLLPNVHEETWGEIYEVTFGRGDKGRIWVHPQKGILLQREGKDWTRHFSSSFKNVLFSRRSDKQLSVNFMDINEWQVTFGSKEIATDCHIYIEGMVNLTGDPHSYQNADVSWPMLIEERRLGAFGPLSFQRAKELLTSRGFCLLRRGADQNTSSGTETHSSSAKDRPL
jgi:hypothetical protein